MAREYPFYTRWEGKNLKCACLVFSPCCDKYKECEELELGYSAYSGIKECMGERSYKRTNRRMRQR